MVGDSPKHDVEGGLRAGMRAVLLDRSGRAGAERVELAARGVAVIRSLRELPDLVIE
jgi:FMN phosphatase YigB (HAD superfamily)